VDDRDVSYDAHFDILRGKAADRYWAPSSIRAARPAGGPKSEGWRSWSTASTTAGAWKTFGSTSNDSQARAVQPRLIPKSKCIGHPEM
jgi:hypothetical protein